MKINIKNCITVLVLSLFTLLAFGCATSATSKFKHLEISPIVWDKGKIITPSVWNWASRSQSPLKKDIKEVLYSKPNELEGIYHKSWQESMMLQGSRYNKDIDHKGKYSFVLSQVANDNHTYLIIEMDTGFNLSNGFAYLNNLSLTDALTNPIIDTLQTGVAMGFVDQAEVEPAPSANRFEFDFTSRNQGKTDHFSAWQIGASKDGKKILIQLPEEVLLNVLDSNDIWDVSIMEYNNKEWEMLFVFQSSLLD